MKLVDPTIKSAVSAALEHYYAVNGGSCTHLDTANIAEITRKTGLGKNTVYEWRKRNNARFEEFKAFIQACGGRITIEFD